MLCSRGWGAQPPPPCRLLAPLYSKYRMNKAVDAQTQLPVPMDQPVPFPKFGDRLFAIAPADLAHAGFGYDRSGAREYLAPLLQAVAQCNGGEERLAPLHAEGDGHCLVHALSRCLTGRELFWHALRLALHRELSDRRDDYLAALAGFIVDDEWPTIVAEAHPDYVPPADEMLGLRPVHVFGLANVLHRPVVLVDSLERMVGATGEFAAVFLPVLRPPAACAGADGTPHAPLFVAWSNAANTHYVPLCPVLPAAAASAAAAPPAFYPAALLPPVWSAAGGDARLAEYVAINADGNIPLVGARPSFTQECVVGCGCWWRQWCRPPRRHSH